MKPCFRCGTEEDVYSNGECKKCARDRAKAYYYANRDACNARGRAWFDENPLIRRVGQMNSRAKKYNVPGRLRKADIEAIVERWNDRCAYCLGEWDHLDHIIGFEEGGTNERENISLACTLCNARKSKKSKKLVPSIASEFWPPDENLLRPWKDWVWTSELVIARGRN